LSLFYEILDSYSLSGKMNHNQFISFIKKLYKLDFQMKESLCVSTNTNNTNLINSKNNNQFIYFSNKNLININNLNRRKSTKNINNNIYLDNFKVDTIENRLNNSIDVKNSTKSYSLPKFKEINNNLNIKNDIENNGLYTNNNPEKEFEEQISLENFDNKLDNYFIKGINRNKIDENSKSTIKYNKIDNKIKNNEENLNNDIQSEINDFINKEKENKNDEFLSCNISMSKEDFKIENKEYNKNNINGNFTTPFKNGCGNISSFIPNNNNNLTLSFNSYLFSNNNNNKKNSIINLRTNSYKKITSNFEIQNTLYIKNKTFFENKNICLSKKSSNINADISEKISNLVKYFKNFSSEDYLFDLNFIFNSLCLFFEATLEDRFSILIIFFNDIQYDSGSNLKENKQKVSYDDLLLFFHNSINFIIYFSKELDTREIEKYSLSSKKDKNNLNQEERNKNFNIYDDNTKTEIKNNIFIKNKLMSFFSIEKNIIEISEFIVNDIFNENNKKSDEFVNLEILINYFERIL